MSLLTYFGSHLSKVRPGSVRLTEVANMAEVGSGTILIEDEAGTQEVIGHKGIRLEEPDCSVVTTFRGHVGDRRYSRGVMEVGASRIIEIDVIDANAQLGFDVIRGSAWRKRPRETIDERLAALLSSGFMSGVSDHGFVGSSSIELDKADLRGQRPGDVLNDMAVRAGFNVFVYWDEAASDYGLWFQNSNTSTDWSSTLRLSNVAADIDSSTTFAIGDLTQLNRSPARVVSGVWMPFKKGNVYRTRPETEETFQERDGTAPMANVKKRNRARNIADRYLRHHKTEEDTIRVPGIFLPSDKVNLIRAGQRIQAKFSHFDPEGYADAFTWFRVLERTVSMPFGDDNDYELELVLSPQEAGDECVGAEGVDLVQFAMANHPSDTDLDLPDPPTVGNTMILAVGHRDELSVGPLPESIDGWTRVPINAGPLSFPYALDDGGTGLSHCDLWYRPVESGDTGLVSDFDGLKILAEFTGILDPVSGARAETSDQNDSTVSITSGDPGGDALVISAIITRQDDTGRINPDAGTSMMPLDETGAPPSSTGVGHTCLYLMWAVSTGSPVTLSGEMSGANNDAGPQWGARLAAFEACS